MQEACRQNKEQTKTQIWLLTCAWLWQMLLGDNLWQILSRTPHFVEMRFSCNNLFFPLMDPKSHLKPYGGIKRYFCGCTWNRFKADIDILGPLRGTYGLKLWRRVEIGPSLFNLLSSFLQQMEEVELTFFYSLLILQPTRQPCQARSHDAVYFIWAQHAENFMLRKPETSDQNFSAMWTDSF